MRTEVGSSSAQTELDRLLYSRELRDLQERCLHSQRRSLTDLKDLQRGPQLAQLDRLVRKRQVNVFQVLETLERIDRNDELLHTLLLEGFLQEGNHQFGLSVVKELSRRVNFYREGKQLDGFSLPSDLAGTVVRRDSPSQQGLIDLKINNLEHQFVLLIENKTTSPEGKRQLERYWQDAEREHPGFSIAGIYLTLDGRQPTTEGEKYKRRYRALSYGELADILDAPAKRLASTNPSRALVTQYTSAIRRWFVADPKMNEIAWRIFRKYPEAADFLSSGAARPTSQLFSFLESLIKGNLDLIEVHTTNAEKTVESSWFVPKEWDDIPSLRRAVKDKDTDGRLLILWFYCCHDASEVQERELTLCVGAGGSHPEHVKRVIEAAKSWPPPSKGFPWATQPQADWTDIWGRRFSTEQELKRENREEVFKDIKKRWDQFLVKELPTIRDSVVASFPKK